MSETAPFNFFDPEYRANPYPVLARLRERDPVCRSPMGWVITRHADVARLNRDKRLGRDLDKVSNGMGPSQFFKGHEGLLEFNRTAMFHVDAPDHTRIRKLMAYAFTPAAMSSMRAVVAEVTAELIAELPDSGPVDLIEALAKPLPVRIICEMLGVPREDFAAVAAWSEDLAETVEVTITAEQKKRADAAYHAFTDYLAGLVERQRALAAAGEVGDTLIGRLIAAESETEAISARELLANLAILLTAGHETTTNLIGNGVLSLLEHPDQLELLRDEPELVDSAVEEALRYESPANINARVTFEDIEVGGKTIRAGRVVLCMLGAANRDPEVFADPDRLDIRRDPNPHQSFGGGPHFCIGAHLARLEGREAFRQLFERYPSIELDRERVRWSPRMNLRGLSELGLVVARGRARRGA